MNQEQIVDLCREHSFFTWSVQSQVQPLTAVKGEGVYFWDADGKPYLDFSSQLMNVNAGHGQPKIVAAIQEQAAAIAYAYPGIATMLNFDVADCDKDRAFRFLDALRIILPATTLGDIYSLIVNPARTTHHWLDEEELARVGISPGTFRMSVGIENIEDLKEDLDQTLKACR